MTQHRLSDWMRVRRATLADAAATAALCVLWWAARTGEMHSFAGWPLRWGEAWCWIWSVMLTLPYALHRTRPTFAVRWFLAVLAAQMLVGPGPLTADVMGGVMLYAGLVYGPRDRARRWIVTAGVCDAATALLMAVQSVYGSLSAFLHALSAHEPSLAWRACRTVEHDGSTSLLCTAGLIPEFLGFAMIITVCVVLVVVVGFWQRARQQTIRMLNERNEAIRAREQEERLIAASAERARIARDMHDVVAHTLSIIIIQSDGGRYAAVNDPELARGTMETIRGESQRALDDMTRLLGVFDDGPHADYHDIDALIRQARDASRDMVLTREIVGEARPAALSPAASVAMYHVVQEALTNVRKYAGRDVRVRVEERWDEQALTLTIDDDGRGASASMDGHKPGYGLLGMNERIGAVGGAVESGPRLGGGFRVRASVPLGAADACSPAAARRAHGPDDDAPATRDRDGGDDASRERVVWPTFLQLGRRLRAKPIVQAHEEGRANWIVRLSQWCERHYMLVDATVALLAFTTLMMGGATRLSIIDPTAPAGYAANRAVAVAMSALLLAPLAVRRRFPRAAALMFALATMLQLLVDPICYMADLAAPFYVYAAALYGASGSWRWLVPAIGVDGALFGLKGASLVKGYPTLLAWLTGAEITPPGTGSVAWSVMVEFTLMACGVCLIAMMLGLWMRLSGANPLVLQARAEALRAEQDKQRITAANMERDRISRGIQTEVSETLHAVIAQTTTQLDRLDEQMERGERPSAESINAAFGAIGTQGRTALARMRQLLSVLRETGFSDEHVDEDAHMTMPLRPVDAMVQSADYSGGHD